MTIGETMVATAKAEVIFDRTIKALGNSAGIYVPKRYLGKRATVIIFLEDEKVGEHEKACKKS